MAAGLSRPVPWEALLVAGLTVLGLSTTAAIPAFFWALLSFAEA